MNPNATAKQVVVVIAIAAVLVGLVLVFVPANPVRATRQTKEFAQ
jgi:uncharacterized membrane protein